MGAPVPLTEPPRREEHVLVGTLAADYVVVGAGAAGMAFTDALITRTSA